MKCKLINIQVWLMIFSVIVFGVIGFCVENTTFLVVISLYELVISLFAIKIKKEQFFTFASVFMILSYVLHMGNLVVVCLFGHNNTYIVSENESILIKAICFFMLCHLFFLIGILQTNRYKSKYKVSEKIVITERGLKATGAFCFAIGVFPRVYIDYKQITMQMSSSYVDSLGQLKEYGVLSILAQFFYVGVLILLFELKEQKWQARTFLILVTVWEAISMLSGGRIYAISLIVAMMYVYFIRVEKMKSKHILFLVSALLLSCVLLSTIATIRINGSFDFETLVASMKNGFVDNNPVFAFIAEMGSTMKTVIYTIRDIPDYASHANGLSYIEAVLSVIPIFESEIANINHLIYIYNFRSFLAMGGSWIGEAYYNFSWLGCLFCLWIGKMLSGIEDVFERDEKKNSWFSTTCILSFIFYIITYTRDYFYRFCTTIQVCIVVVIVAWIFSHIKIKNSIRKG